MIDLLIAGGGPAGLATAIFASKAGMSVLVVEPHRGPIDKACGEGIMPAGRVFLERMGVALPSGKPFAGIRYHRNGRTATGRFRSGSGLGIRRTDLSEALWRRAGELGVERRQGRIKGVELSTDSVLAHDIRARWLVAADGLNSSIGQSVGITAVKTRRSRFGVRRHFEMEDEGDYVDVYLGDFHEAYVTPVGNGIVGVAILSSGPERFENGLAVFPELLERLGEPVGKVQGAGPFGRFASRVSKGRMALVGDAAGFLDPITGEGIRLGFEAAEIVVECLLRERLEEYDAAWRRAVRRYRSITSGLLMLRRNPYLKEAIVPTLNLAPGIFDKMLGLLGEV